MVRRSHERRTPCSLACRRRGRRLVTARSQVCVCVCVCTFSLMLCMCVLTATFVVCQGGVVTLCNLSSPVIMCHTFALSATNGRPAAAMLRACVPPERPSRAEPCRSRVLLQARPRRLSSFESCDFQRGHSNRTLRCAGHSRRCNSFNWPCWCVLVPPCA